MLDDFINMTHGQLFVKYWWLWLMILVGGAIFYWCCAPDSKNIKGGSRHG